MLSAPVWLDQIVLLKQISSVCESCPSWVKPHWEIHPSPCRCRDLWDQANSSLKDPSKHGLSGVGFSASNALLYKSSCAGFSN